MDRPRPRWRSILVLICASLAAGVPTAAAQEIGDIEQLPLAQGCISESIAEGCAPGHGLGFADGVAVSPDGQHVYAASLDSDALTIFDRIAGGGLDQKEDALGCVSHDGDGVDCTDGRALDGANNLAVSPDGENVYVVSSGSDAVTIFDREPDGTVTQKGDGAGCITGEDSEGEGCTVAGSRGFSGSGLVSIAVSPDGRNVYVGGHGGMAIFDRSAGGSLSQKAGPAGCAGGPIEEGCGELRGPGVAQSMAFSPDGRNLYVSGGGPGWLAIFERNADGTLTQLSGAAGCYTGNAPDTGGDPTCTLYRPGDFLTDSAAVAVSPDGRNAYVGHSATGASVAALIVFDRVDAGALDPTQCVSPTVAGCDDADGLITPDSIQVSPDGLSVYLANRYFADEIAVFDRSTATGAVSQPDPDMDCFTSGSSDTCEHANGIGGASAVAISPEGDSIYFSAIFSDAVAIFDRVAGAPLPSVSIGDVALPEGDSGTTAFTFGVTLSAPAPAGGVTVDYATSDGAATAPGDYTAASGTVTFAEDEAAKTVTVDVSGDTEAEPDEDLFVNLFNAQGARVADAKGAGAIQSDDEAPAAPTLTVVKQVVNDGGGVKQPGGFTLHVKQDGTDVAGSPQAGSATGTTYTLDPGSYSVSEDAVASYAASFSDDCNASGEVTLAPGDEKTCTVTNDDVAGAAVVLGYSVERSGTAWALDGGFLTDTRGYVEDPANFGPGGVVPQPLQVGPGIDTASAATLAGVDIFFTGYVPTTSYTDAEKQALRDFVLGGGTLIATTDSSEFTMVDVFGVTQGDGGSGESQITNTAHPIADGPFGAVAEYHQFFTIGHYSSLGPDAVEIGRNDTGPSLAVIERGKLGPGSGAVVLVADIDVFSDAADPGGGSALNATLIKNIFAFAANRPTTLRVVKQTVNDDGGTKAPGDFSLHVKQEGAEVAGSPQAGSATGSAYTLPAGSYAVSEDPVPGYQGTFSGDCAADGSITMAAGDDKTCTVTNDDVAPTLTVVKHVVNDDGGTAEAADWSMHVRSGAPPADVPGSPFPGSEAGTATTLDAGSYVVSESGGPSGYDASFSGDCNASGQVTLQPGESKTCTITNDDVTPAEALVVETYDEPRTDGDYGLIESFLDDTRGYVQDPANFGPGGVVPQALQVGQGIPTASAGTLAGVDIFFTGWVGTPTYSDDEKQALRDFVLGGGTLIATTDDTSHTMVDAFGLTQADAQGNPTRNEISDLAHPIADGSFGTVTEYNQYALTGYYSDLGPDAVPVGGQVDDAGDLIPGRTTLAVIERGKLGPGSGAVIFVADVDVFSDADNPGGGSVFNETLIKNIFAYAASGEASPALLVEDLTKEEGDAGNTAFTFTVRLSTPSSTPVDVHWATADGTATSPSDYAAASGDLHFAAGDTSEELTVQVSGDTTVEPDEQFRVNLSNAVGARIADARGIGEIANDDEPPATATLRVVKQVVNDDGGTGGAADFDLHVTQGGVDVAGSPQPGDEAGTAYTLDPGAYAVGESGGPAGYASSISGDCAGDGTITLAPGDDKTCTITNDDVAPRLTVVKHVVNDDGGIAVAGDWSMHVQTGLPLADVAGSPFPGSETGTELTLDAGSYAVSESDGPKGYTISITGDCAADGTVELAPGDEKTCTVTNDDDEPPATATLRVVKHVVNDNGGTAAAGQWSMHVRSGPTDVPGSPFPGSEAGTSMTLQAGTYTLGESGGPAGYAESISGDCAADGQITLRAGDDKTCTITNDDVAPTLRVVKHVVNDDGGTAAAGAWSMHVRSGAPLADVAGSPFAGSEAGTELTLDAGSYAVSESGGPGGYTASIAGDCAADGTVTLAPGDEKACTIANDDPEPPPPPPPSTADLELSKSVSDATPALGDEFTYSITVFNRGPGTAAAVVVTDDLPAGLRLVSAPAGCSTGPVVCGLGDLASGASRTVVLTVRARLGCEFVGTSGDDRDGAIGSSRNRDLICGGGGRDTFSGGGERDRMYGFAPPGMLPEEISNTATVSSATPDPDPADNAAEVGVRVVGGRDMGDTISGEGGPDKLYGAAGNDHLSGGNGADRLEGDKGKDVLDGGAHNDRILAAGEGRDRILCGPGSDRVTADPNDKVADDCERVIRRRG